MTANGVERITRLEERMNTVEEGVANFRDFQREAREFFSEFRFKEQARKEALLKQQQEVRDSLENKDRADSKRDKRIIRWLTFFGILLTAILTVLAYETLRDSQKKSENNILPAPHAQVQSQHQDATEKAPW